MALYLKDLTDNANDLTNVNAVAEYTADLPFTTGNVRAAAFVSASSKYFTIVDAASLKPTTAFTVEAWIKGDSFAADDANYIFQTYSQNTAVAGFKIRINSTKVEGMTGKNTGTTLGTDYQKVTGTTALSINTWYHVAFTYDGTNIRVLLNGTVETTTAWSNNPAYAATNYIVMGARNGAGTYANFFDGKIDDVRIWNIYRSAATIAAEKDQELIGNETGLVAYWPFEKAAPSGGMLMFF